MVYGLLIRKIVGWASSRVLGPFGPSYDSKRLLRLLSIKKELSTVFTAKFDLCLRMVGRHELNSLRSSGDSIVG